MKKDLRSQKVTGGQTKDIQLFINLLVGHLVCSLSMKITPMIENNNRIVGLNSLEYLVSIRRI